MDWSSTLRSDRRVALLLGVVLLLNPLVVGVTDVGDPDRYRYEAATVVGQDGSIDVPLEVQRVDDDVLCLDQPITRTCMLERAALARGGLVYDGLPAQVLDRDYEYLYDEVNGTDRFYRPITTETAGGEIRYTHERVPLRTALREVSVSLAMASAPVERAIEEGAVITSDPLPGANRLVRTGSTYVVVHRVAMHETEGERRGIVLALQWLAGGLGVALVHRAGAA